MYRCRRLSGQIFKEIDPNTCCPLGVLVQSCFLHDVWNLGSGTKWWSWGGLIAVSIQFKIKGTCSKQVENRNTSKHTDDRFKGCCIIVAQFFRGIPADKPAFCEHLSSHWTLILCFIMASLWNSVISLYFLLASGLQKLRLDQLDLLKLKAKNQSSCLGDALPYVGQGCLQWLHPYLSNLWVWLKLFWFTSCCLLQVHVLCWSLAPPMPRSCAFVIRMMETFQYCVFAAVQQNDEYL